MKTAIKKNGYILILVLMLGMIGSCTDESSNPTPTSTDDRDKLVGAWLCSEGSGTPFTIEISKLGDDRINIKNFSNFGANSNARCEVAGNSITIPFQDVNDLSVTTSATGSGIYSKTGSQEKITLNYIVDTDTFNNVICTK